MNRHQARISLQDRYMEEVEPIEDGDGRKIKTGELKSIKDKCSVEANIQLMNKSYQHTKGKGRGNIGKTKSTMCSPFIIRSYILPSRSKGQEFTSHKSDL